MDRWSGLFGLATLCHLLLLAHSLELRRTTEIEFHSALSSPQSVQQTLMRINYSIPDYWLNIVAKLIAIWKFYRNPTNSKRHLLNGYLLPAEITALVRAPNSTRGHILATYRRELRYKRMLTLSLKTLTPAEFNLWQLWSAPRFKSSLRQRGRSSRHFTRSLKGSVYKVQKTTRYW